MSNVYSVGAKQNTTIRSGLPHPHLNLDQVNLDQALPLAPNETLQCHRYERDDRHIVPALQKNKLIELVPHEIFVTAG